MTEWNIDTNRPVDRERAARIEGVVIEMEDEAQRALDKHGPENTMDAPGKSDGERLAILMEEVGEVAHELTYDAGVNIESIPGSRVSCELKSDSFSGTMLLPDGRSEWLLVDDLSDDALAVFGYRRTTARQRLRKELIQVGAMAATWAAMLGEEQA